MQKSVSRFTKIVLGASLGLAILLTFGSVGLNIYFAHEASQADTERRETSNALAALQDEYQGLYMEYTDVVGGEPEAATPSQVNDAVEEATPGVPGATGATGPAGRAPTAAEIGSAVRSYCAILNQCIGERGQEGAQGEPGEPGEDGTDGADGVDGLNGARGSAGATGAAGAKGDTGSTGATGAKGDTGAPGKDSTVPGPAGPAGPAGANGTNGVDGRSVSSVSCIMDGIATYVVFYDQAGVEIGRVQSSCLG